MIWRSVPADRYAYAYERLQRRLSIQSKVPRSVRTSALGQLGTVSVAQCTNMPPSEQVTGLLWVKKRAFVEVSL